MNNLTYPPKVFISHASEDKERFVLRFAKDLRENGVDAWIDCCEMAAGDSLIDKIFEEGLGQTDTVIIVLSKASMQSLWVQKELNVASARIITGKIKKLIPVLIEECDVPVVLEDILWERIAPSYKPEDPSFQKIISAVFGISNKPQIGSPPAYITNVSKTFGGLSLTDSFVLKRSCEKVVNTRLGELLKSENLFVEDGKWLVPKSEVSDSLDILDREGYLNVYRNNGPIIGSNYLVTTSGFEIFANENIPHYQSKVNSVISKIVNENIHDKLSIQFGLNEPGYLIGHILDVLEENGLINQSKATQGISYIFNISPKLKRMLSGGA